MGDLHKKYLDDITSRYSLGRALSFLVWLVSLYIFIEIESFNFVGSISEIPISFLLDTKTGLLSKVSLLFLFLAICFTSATAWLNNLLKIEIFEVLLSLNVSENSEYEKNLNLKLSRYGQFNYEQFNKVQKILDFEKKSFRRLQGACEVTIAIGICAGIGKLSFNLFDALLMFMMCAVFLRFQYKAFTKYIADIFPYLVILKADPGAKVTILGGINYDV